jgi:putative sigma-54 modulation protein
MQLNITARHLKLTPAINDYVQKKLDKAHRFLEHLIWAQVILDVTKNRHEAEIILHTRGRTFTAKEGGADLYAAIDLASDKLDEQLRRFKGKRNNRRPSPLRKMPLPEWAMGLPDMLEEELSDARISGMRTLRLSALTLNAAISAMEQSDSAHWIFINERNQRVTVVYRKPDKTYGVVEALS